MRYFIDTEFIERGPSKPIQLISIGIVAEDGREFYAIHKNFNPSDASEWVMDNVICKLESSRYVKRLDRWDIAECVKSFIGTDKPEFWGYYADYDWVVFCQLFGAMIDLPEGFPMYCRDIKQLCDDKGNPKLPEQGKGEHNALADARWNKAAWEFLNAIPKTCYCCRDSCSDGCECKAKVELCESCTNADRPDTPAVTHDAVGVPLCQVCKDGLIADAAGL